MLRVRCPRFYDTVGETSSRSRAALFRSSFVSKSCFARPEPTGKVITANFRKISQHLGGGSTGSARERRSHEVRQRYLLYGLPPSPFVLSSSEPIYDSLY